MDQARLDANRSRISHSERLPSLRSPFQSCQVRRLTFRLEGNMALHASACRSAKLHFRKGDGLIWCEIEMRRKQSIL